MAGADWAVCLASRRQVNSYCDVRRDAARHHTRLARAVTLGDARRLLRGRPASPRTGADRDEIRVIAETAKNEICDFASGSQASAPGQTEKDRRRSNIAGQPPTTEVFTERSTPPVSVNKRHSSVARPSRSSGRPRFHLAMIQTGPRRARGPHCEVITL